MILRRTFLLLGFLGAPFLVWAAGPSEGALLTAPTLAEEPYENYGEEFARPLARLDIRLKYQNRTDGSGSLRNTYRVDYPWLLPNGWKLGGRLDLPLAANDRKTRENAKGHWDFGMGDVLTQLALTSPEDNRFGYGAGLRVLWPTATELSMGAGKYQLSPGVGAGYRPARLPAGSVLQFVWREPFSVGGDGSRKDVHTSILNPSATLALPGRLHLTSSPDIQIDWENDAKWFVPFNLQIGKRFGENWIASLEWNQALHKGDKNYNWDLEARLGYFF